MLLQKFVIVIGVIVHADRQNGDVGALQLLLQLLERRHFIDARRAPRRPKIQHDNFSPQLAQSHAAVGIFNREIWRGRADTGGLGTAIAAGEGE